MSVKQVHRSYHAQLSLTPLTPASLGHIWTLLTNTEPIPTVGPTGNSTSYPMTGQHTTI